MMDDKPKRGLGRGLSALLGDAPEDELAPTENRTPVEVPIEHLQSGRFQPRMDFEPEALQDLADSIRTRGVLQPILVRRLPEDADRFEIIAGERRWRASQLAQRHSVPVLIRDFTDREAAEVALVENLQRRDLGPLEEAEGYRRLQEEFNHTQDDLSQAVGKSRSHVANMMRLLGLPDPVKGMLRDGRLSAGHARALLNAADPVTLAEAVVKKGLNVRQTEKLATDKGGVKARKPRVEKEVAEKDTDTLALERDLANLLGLKVSIEFQGRGGGGRVVIHYETLEQLDDILYRLNNPTPNRADARRGGEDDGDDVIDEGFAAAFTARATAQDEDDVDAAVAALAEEVEEDDEAAALDAAADAWAEALSEDDSDTDTDTEADTRESWTAAARSSNG